MKFISWRQLTHMKAGEAAAYLREGVNVTSDGSVVMVLQNVDKADLSKIPGVFRGMPPVSVAGPTPAREPPPEPEIINAVRYQRGVRYARGTPVAIYNPRTRRTDIVPAPETDAEGNEVWE